MNQPGGGATGACWCGANAFADGVHADYVVCGKCGTSVLRLLAERGRAALEKELQSYYEPKYWNEHMDELGFPRLLERARLDLAERCQWWLKHLLFYLRPPARVLEIGCAHGAFVKLLDATGFAATGMEMSEGVLAEARRIFGVRTALGPIETSDLPKAHFDAIVLFDVLEHFVAPEDSLRAIVAHLRPGGLVVVQTPEFRAGLAADWEHFKHPEHVHLFTRDSLLDLYRRVGLEHCAFEPPVFPYDMFAFASAAPLVRGNPEASDEFLQQTPERRLVLAMQDLYWQALGARGNHAIAMQQLDAARSEARALGEAARSDRETRSACERQLAATRAELDRLRASRWVRLGKGLKMVGDREAGASTG